MSAISKQAQTRKGKRDKNYSKSGVRLRDKEYLDWIRHQPCLVCGAPAEATHDEPLGKSMKSADYFTLPLCREHHQGDTGEHHIGKKAFWLKHGKNETGDWRRERVAFANYYNFKYSKEKHVSLDELRWKQ